MVDKSLVANARYRMLVVVAVILVGALAVSFGMAAATPQTAHASGKTTIWVVTKAKLNDSGYVSTTTFKYNKKGLLKSKNEGGQDYIYKYDKKYRLKSSANIWGAGGTDKSTTKYTVNKKGYVVKCVEKMGSQSFTMTFSYNSKGRLTKANTIDGVVKYRYNNKGRLKSCTKEWGTDTVSYDKKGRIKSIKNGSEPLVDKGVYKNGRLAKIVTYNDGAKYYVNSFSYKKISVPKKYAKMVKAQQAALLWNVMPLEAAHR